MSRAFVVLVVAGAVGLSASVGLGDAAVTVTDIGVDDVAGLSQPIRAFPVPAAAGWTGPAYLIYDNYAEGLQFSASEVYADFWWTTPPFSNASVAIHGVTHDYQYNIDPTMIAIQDGTDYFTNEEGSELDAPEGTPPPDKRWPYHIPRPGRYCGQDFSCLYFDLTQDVHQFGVFLPSHSNTFSSTPGEEWDDHNYVQANCTVDVYVHGIGEDWTLAQHQQVGVSGYCPFLMIEDADLIDAVTIIHNCGWAVAPTYGFMDVYVGAVLPPLGDATGEGCVDGADYTVWADHYLWTGQAAYSAGGWTVGNWNEDDTVDGADYTAWADHYLSGCGAQVPEPATLSVLGLGACLALLRRKR